jgi:predicted RNA-binding Zn-ribbon protein involved in translation (DUF1610 family)
MSNQATAMTVAGVTPFECPNCGAQYKIVRVETDGAVPEGQLTCRTCGGPLHGREGRFILKYFLVDRPRRKALGRRTR